MVSATFFDKNDRSFQSRTGPEKSLSGRMCRPIREKQPESSNLWPVSLNFQAINFNLFRPFLPRFKVFFGEKRSVRSTDCMDKSKTHSVIHVIYGNGQESRIPECFRRRAEIRQPQGIGLKLNRCVKGVRRGAITCRNRSVIPSEFVNFAPNGRRPLRSRHNRD